MKKLFSSIKGKILLLILVPMLIFLFEHIYIIGMQKSQLYDSKKEMIKSIVITSHNVIIAYKKLVDSGKMTKEEAQKRSIEYLDKVRYQKGNNYIFGYKYNGDCFNSPLTKTCEGVNKYNAKDKNGVQLIKELIDRAKEGGGYVEYIWTAGTKVDAPKISYSKGIDDWEWMIGTGVYVDDVEETLFLYITEIILLFLGIGVLMLFLIFWVFKTVISKIDNIKSTMSDIAEGDGDLTVSLPLSGNDELTDLSKNLILLSIRYIF